MRYDKDKLTGRHQVGTLGRVVSKTRVGHCPKLYRSIVAAGRGPSIGITEEERKRVRKR